MGSTVCRILSCFGSHCTGGNYLKVTKRQASRTRGRPFLCAVGSYPSDLSSCSGCLFYQCLCLVPLDFNWLFKSQRARICKRELAPLLLRYFWYFWLTSQNTTTSQVRNLFSVIAVFVSFSPWRAAVAAAAAGFCCCCCIILGLMKSLNNSWVYGQTGSHLSNII